MKMNRIPDGWEITNTPRTVMGALFTAATPLVLGSVLVDWLTAGEPLSESWFILAEVGVLTVIWLIWLCTGFRKKALTYAYVFDKNGVREKRLVGRGKSISWADMEEYVCEYIGYRGKTHMPLYCVTFTSSRSDRHDGKPTVITTPSFPEPQLPVFRDQLFSFCDAMREAAGGE